jgi:hypothetical protein
MMVQSEEGESQAEVIWKISREGIQSLTLDMASQHVRLILAEKKADRSYRLLVRVTASDFTTPLRNDE